MKSPVKKIGGFGFFATASRLPVSLAWETFGEMNGAPTFERMLALIRAYRKGPEDSRDDPVIGCRIVGDVVFFPESHWVDQPADWRRPIVQGKRYDTTSGEGRRVWTECLARAADLRSDWVNDPALKEIYEGARFGRPVPVQRRLGQGSFKVAVLDAYGRACAVTTEHSLPVLEAAHIKPYADGGLHDYGNGILLRSDVHRLFDKGYMSIDPNYRIHVSRRLREEWKNGVTYYPFEGREIEKPEDESRWPDRNLLEWHYDEVFRR